MKFCVLMGSLRRDGNTAALLRPFLEECEAMDVEAETIWLCDKEIRPCLGARPVRTAWTGRAVFRRTILRRFFRLW